MKLNKEKVNKYFIWKTNAFCFCIRTSEVMECPLCIVLTPNPKWWSMILVLMFLKWHCYSFYIKFLCTKILLIDDLILWSNCIFLFIALDMIVRNSHLAIQIKSLIWKRNFIKIETYGMTENTLIIDHCQLLCHFTIHFLWSKFRAIKLLSHLSKKIDNFFLRVTFWHFTAETFSWLQICI